MKEKARELQDILTLALVNFKPYWGCKENNLFRILDYIETAAGRGADLVLFPEMALTGYDNEEKMVPAEKMQHRLAESSGGPSTEAIASLTRKLGIYSVVGMPERDLEQTETVYNSALVTGPEGYIGHYRKIHTALQEICWCDSGENPFLFDTPWGKIGVGICADTYTYHELLRFYGAKGARLYLNPTAVLKTDEWDWREYLRLGLSSAVETSKMFLATANLAGRDLITDFAGCSTILGPGIDEYAHIYGGSFQAGEEEVFYATIDLSMAERDVFATNPITGTPDYRPDIYKKLYEIQMEDPKWWNHGSKEGKSQNGAAS